jgi:hypothetical protein
MSVFQVTETSLSLKNLRSLIQRVAFRDKGLGAKFAIVTGVSLYLSPPLSMDKARKEVCTLTHACAHTTFCSF